MVNPESIRLTWLGHATWYIELGSHRIVVDPFLSDSPTAPCSADSIVADHVLITHGHTDHVMDAASIARRCAATIVAIHEIAEWYREKRQISRTQGMNRGGWMPLPFGRVKMTFAIHSSQLPDGSYGGEASGFVIEAAGRRIYIAGDTAVFSDMQLIGDLGIDLAIIPIGDLYTMGVDDSIQAIRWLRPDRVLPSHYNTWPPIAQDAPLWADRVRRETESQPIVLKPGESMTLPTKLPDATA
jgi:L-ascorbate metabolism protein UlaG (beta-lactamase superfamily)